MPPAPDGPLGDLLVVDLTRALAGPQAAMMLGDLGARVVKVESPTGDDTRAWGPPWAAEPGGGRRDSTYFMAANRNKESIALDLRDPADADVLARLVERADVLLENFRPGVLDRLGFPLQRLHALNPGLVVGAITGFGHDGPEAGRGGYDQIAQGEGGLMSVTGAEEPTKVGVPIADLLAGMNLAYGVLAALHERRRTGRGRVVRTSLLASVVAAHAFQGTRWTIGGERPGRSGRYHPSIAPYGLFTTATGAIQVAVGSEGLWRDFAACVGLDAEDQRFLTNTDRVAHRDELVGEIEAVLAHGSAEDWLARLIEAGVPAGRVRSVPEVYSWEQTRSQGLLMELEHPAYGPITLPGSALRLDDDPWSGGRRRPLPPPMLDEHGAALREWLAGPEAADAGSTGRTPTGRIPTGRIPTGRIPTSGVLTDWQTPRMTTRERPYSEVDVFTAEPYLGNPVAVVHSAGDLDTSRMQRFASWTNLSETTFLLPPTRAEADYRVRIFTPAEELPFAGHPTLGTCHAWLGAGGLPRRSDRVVQECGVGLVSIRLGARPAFAAPPLLRQGPVDAATLAEVVEDLRVRPDDVLDAAWIDNGPGWLGVVLPSAADVLALRPGTVRRDIGVLGAHPEGGECAVEVRAFFRIGDATIEDPVTGSLNASFGQWLLGTGRLQGPYVAAQGTAIGRAGRVHVDADDDGEVWVGGDAVTCVTGTVVL